MNETVNEASTLQQQQQQNKQQQQQNTDRLQPDEMQDLNQITAKIKIRKKKSKLNNINI